MIKDDIKRLVGAREARVGVIGLGYVGLPLAAEFARRGFPAVGFEVDANKADAINRGESYIADVSSSQVKELAEAERLVATTRFDRLKDCDAIIICVPTPLRKTKEPDISYILAAAEEIKKNLRRGQLVILESTTYPGTTDEVLLPLFEEAGLKLDEDFLLAFSPERVDPGNPQFQTHNIPKVVGGCTEDSTEAAAQLYSQIVKEVHAVSSARVAEAAKLLENTFRAVNIGMANEMARLCYALGIDTWEVIRAAATKPFGFMPFYPGPGIGGHCIPLDPHYLSWKARQHGFDSRFIGLAEEVNSRMPEHVVTLVADGLNDERKSLNGSRVLLLGVAYKRDIDDVRESPPSRSSTACAPRARTSATTTRSSRSFASTTRTPNRAASPCSPCRSPTRSCARPTAASSSRTTAGSTTSGCAGSPSSSWTPETPSRASCAARAARASSVFKFKVPGSKFKGKCPGLEL